MWSTFVLVCLTGRPPRADGLRLILERRAEICGTRRRTTRDAGSYLLRTLRAVQWRPSPL